MGILTDSSILVEHERGMLDLGELLSRFAGDDGFLSVITASELLHGVHRAHDPVRRARRLAAVEALLAALPVLPVDMAVARVHAGLSAYLKQAGTPIGVHDTWIGATCLVHAHVLVTRNVRDFSRIPGVKVHTGGSPG
jgi:tRNA(fMet)-specific endonuclease VapC